MHDSYDEWEKMKRPPKESYTNSLSEISGRNHSMVELRRMMRDRCL